MPATFSLPPKLRSEAIFELLASSTLDRYSVMARKFSADQALTYLSSVRTEELNESARSLWRFILSATHREPEEVELAVLMSVIAARASEVGEELLREIAVYDGVPAAVWPSALSRHLLSRRPSDQYAEFSQPMTGVVISEPWGPFASSAANASLGQALIDSKSFASQVAIAA